MNMYATLSADIVKSTKLSDSDTIRIKNHLEAFLDEMENVSEGSWGRVVKGDAFECVLSNPNDILRVALMLKCHVKCFALQSVGSKLSKYGIRIAIAIGELRVNNRESGIIDGEAIYKSGRAIEKKAPNGRGTMIACYEGNNSDAINALISLCDTLINKSTPKQCEVLFYKLSGMAEESVAEKMRKARPTINRHSEKAGWPAIEKAVRYFESIKFE